MCDIAVLAAAATVVTAAGSIMSGQSQAAALSAQAKVEKQRAAFEAERQRDYAARFLGAQRAAYGASGVTLEGTPIDVLADTAAQAELDALAIQWGGQARATALSSQASAARLGGYMGAGAALLEGASSWGEPLTKSLFGPTIPRYPTVAS